MAGVGPAARHDAPKGRQIGRDIERKTVQCHPTLYANADRGNLILKTWPFVGAVHPDADPIAPPLAAYVETGERANEPFFQRGNKAAHIGRAPLEIEHPIDDALVWSVIGEL